MAPGRLSYLFAGRCISSTRELPELPPLPETDLDESWTISWGSIPDCSSVRWVHGWEHLGQPVLRLGRFGERYLLRVPNVADFLLDLRDLSILCAPYRDSSEAAVRHCLLDQVLPRAVSETGSIVVHASVVLDDSSALAFVGRTGAGKSTLAGSFAESLQWPASDDSLVVEPDATSVECYPGYLGLRLFADSADAFPSVMNRYLSGDAYGRKHRLIPRTSSMASFAGKHLVALFLLEASVEKRPTIARLGASDALAGLAKNLFVLDVGSEQSMRTRLSRLARVIEVVPCFRLSCPRAYEALPMARDLVLGCLDERSVA